MLLYFKVFLIVIILLSLAFAGIAIKMFFIKGAFFTKQCSTIETDPGGRHNCSCGQKPAEERCENYEAHHGKGADAARHIHTERLVIKQW
jgi:hypothetical protein